MKRLMVISVLILAFLIPHQGWGQDIDHAALKRSVDRALRYLRDRQLENGSWSNYPGVTALCLTGFARSHRKYREEDGPWMRRPAQFLLQFQNEEGAFVPPDGALLAYNTGVIMVALHCLENPAYEEPIRKAQEYLVGVQCDERLGYESSDKFYGGIGYGSGLRPDLSNLQMALEALKRTDFPENHAVWTRAVCFLERCQNLNAYNDQPDITDDGGFVYYPGFSMADDEEEAGSLRSYGSMTYAGLKSYIYCGLTPDDPRVQAALDWARKNYSVTENPGLGAAGLYYYYTVFARTFSVLEMPEFTDGEGVTHSPYADLVKALLESQRPDGSWLNEGSGRWWENTPELCTAYAVLALTEIYNATEEK